MKLASQPRQTPRMVLGTDLPSETIPGKNPTKNLIHTVQGAHIPYPSTRSAMVAPILPESPPTNPPNIRPERMIMALPKCQNPPAGMGMATIVRTKTRPLKTAVMAMSLAPNVFSRAVTLCHPSIVNLLPSLRMDLLQRSELQRKCFIRTLVCTMVLGCEIQRTWV